MFATFHDVAIKAIAVAVPEHEITIEDELEYYGGSEKKAKRAQKMIGVDKRRIAAIGQTASDFCEAACKKVFQMCPEAQTADALIFVSQSPDFRIPATACILQKKLNLSQDCAAFDINQGCAGYVYGLWVAASMIASKACQNVLLLVGDVATPPLDIRNRITAPIFGDAGSATLISYNSGSAPLHFSLHTDGNGFSHIILPAGGGRLPFNYAAEENLPLCQEIVDNNGTIWHLNQTYMNGKAIFDFTLNVVPSHITQFLSDCSTNQDQLDYIFLHQANKQIVNAIAEKLEVPISKVPSTTFSRYGNLSSASIPAVICDQFGKDGDTGNKTILFCGFGVGLSWGSCLWKPQQCYCSSVITLPAKSISRESTIKFWRNHILGENS